MEKEQLDQLAIIKDVKENKITDPKEYYSYETDGSSTAYYIYYYVKYSEDLPQCMTDEEERKHRSDIGRDDASFYRNKGICFSKPCPICNTKNKLIGEEKSKHSETITNYCCPTCHLVFREYFDMTWY